jgi:CRISPR-associated Cas5-like protein
MLDNAICLRVWGDYACFTRPEMKVERVSYDVMTPSAARGVLEAIMWKPQMVWRVTRIDVLKPIRWISVRRNEVASVISSDNVKSAMNRGKGTPCTSPACQHSPRVSPAFIGGCGLKQIHKVVGKRGMGFRPPLLAGAD